MSGIYIHIPFCKQACNYCNFHFSVSLKNKAAFVEALLNEIELQKNYLQGEEVETIYFGGGTPSLLSAQEINLIIRKLHQHFTISDDAEITLEANPDDLSKENIVALKRTPINRFSIGIQTFHNDDLKFLHRAHDGIQALESIKFAQDAGFTNITIDLIYGIPTLSNEGWLHNLKKLEDLKVPHFSAYCLTVEPKTVLEKFIREKKAPDVDEQKAIGHFEMLIDFAEANNYSHYEISNFCKDGFHSRHNYSYWVGKKYLGLGPSAHSFNGHSRQWNINNNSLYIQALEKNELHFEHEKLTEENRYNEFVMTSLRTINGIDLQRLEDIFGVAKKDILKKSSTVFLENGFLEFNENNIRLTRKGKLLADGIISDLFL